MINIQLRNVTLIPSFFSNPRMNETYVHFYILIGSNVMVVFLPTACMLVSSVLISREMVRATRGNTVNGFLTNDQVYAAEK